MSVTAPETPTDTSPATSSTPNAAARRVDSQRYRVDLIGAAALLVAGAGLAGTLILFRAPSTDSTATATVGSRALSIVPGRDQWYLERASSQTAVAPSGGDLQQAAAVEKTSANTLVLGVNKDRWYEDAASIAPARVSGPPLRDQWYRDAPTFHDAPSLSEQARDRWYAEAP